MRKIIIALSVIFTLNSCYNINESVVQPPDKLLSKEEVVSILTEIQIVEAGFSITENRRDERDLKPQYYQAVLDSHNISLLQLRENVNYYQSSPKVMEEVYETVLANLSKIQSDVKMEVDELQRVQDSLDKLSDSLISDTLLAHPIIKTIPDSARKND